jgi:hypothetical protein
MIVMPRLALDAPSGARRLRRFGGAIVFAATLSSSLALVPGEARALEEEPGVWVATFLEKKLDPVLPRFVGWLDLHARRGAAGQVNIIRPAIGYRILDDLTVHVGYAYVPTIKDDAPDVHEHRPWQQLLYTLEPADGLTLGFRARLEQRFVDTGRDVGHRLRFLFRAGYKPIADLPLIPSISDEVFVDLNDTDWGARTGFEQNRLFVGPGLEMFEGGRLDVGYMNVLSRRAGKQDLMAHVIAMNLVVSF